MKHLSQFISESIIDIMIHESYMDVYEDNEVIGELPKNVCIALNTFYFTPFDKNEKVKIIVNNTDKKVLIRNCKSLYVTITSIFKFINTGWHIFFEENINITLGSGTKGKDMVWSDDCLCDFAELLAFDPDHKFNKLKLFRFDCEHGLPKNNFLDILDLDLLEFEQCKHLTKMPLPYKGNFKNKNLKFNSDAPRANTYFAENGLLVGTEEEVKQHMRKDFLKEFELKQAEEKRKQEIINASKQNPYNIYTYDYGEDNYCVLEIRNNNYYLTWAFKSVDSYQRKYPEDLIMIPGVHIKIDGEEFIIEREYDAACGSFTGGAVILEYKLIK